MDIKQSVCPHCGMHNEYQQISSFSDSIPDCSFCGKAIQKREKRVFTPLGQNATLQLRHISGRGLGVVTASPIHRKSLVERCPALLLETTPYTLRLPAEPYSGSPDSIRMGHMLFPWVDGRNVSGERPTYRALVLGYGMIYNHEAEGHSNLRYEPYIDPDTNRRFVDFYATRDIQAGEELTHTYTTPDRLWFLEKPGLVP